MERNIATRFVVKKAAVIKRLVFARPITSGSSVSLPKEIIDKIKEIFINNKERYGYRRITLELKNQGYNVNHKKVYRIMAKLSLI